MMNGKTAAQWLDAAISRHERHMNGDEPTDGAEGEKSQQKLMNEMKKARAAIDAPGGRMMKSANALAKHGRNGDDVVVHMSRAEVDALCKIQGGKSINPKTGMPEFFGLGGLLAGGSLVGGLLGGIGAGKAGGKAAAGYQKAAGIYGDVYKDQKAAIQPYQQFGSDAMARLSSIYGFGPGGSGQPDFSAISNSPEYQFALQQGQRAVDNGAASRGMAFSGRNIKDTMRFGQGLASSQMQNYLNRLQGFTGVGQNALGQFMNASGNYGQNMGNAAIGVGNARAASTLGRYNALGQGLQQGAQFLGSLGSFGGAVQGLSDANAQWGAATGENPYGG